MNRHTFHFPFALLLSLGLGFTSVAFGGSLITDGRNSCIAMNCNSQNISGVSRAEEPFVIQVFAQAGECLRLAVTGQTGDLAMGVFTATPLFHFVDDDSGVNLRPLIKIDPTPNTGFYVVALSHFAGDPVDITFTLRYGRYDAGNVNCFNPTPSSLASVTQGAKEEFVPDEVEEDEE